MKTSQLPCSSSIRTSPTLPRPLQHFHGLRTLTASTHSSGLFTPSRPPHTSRPLHTLTTCTHSHALYWHSHNLYWHCYCFYYTVSAVIAILKASSCFFTASTTILKPLLALSASSSTFTASISTSTACSILAHIQYNPYEHYLMAPTQSHVF